MLGTKWYVFPNRHTLCFSNVFNFFDVGGWDDVRNLNWFRVSDTLQKREYLVANLFYACFVGGWNSTSGQMRNLRHRMFAWTPDAAATKLGCKRHRMTKSTVKLFDWNMINSILVPLLPWHDRWTAMVWIFGGGYSLSGLHLTWIVFASEKSLKRSYRASRPKRCWKQILTLGCCCGCAHQHPGAFVATEFSFLQLAVSNVRMQNRPSFSVNQCVHFHTLSWFFQSFILSDLSWSNI